MGGSSFRFLLLFLVTFVASCTPATMDGTNPPPQSNTPQGSNCAQIAIACYDEFARQPAKIICFREQSRWPTTDLTWRFENTLPGIDENELVDAATAAFAAWADASNLNFTHVTDATADINLSFEQGSHGDDFPFDGPGRNLAHAFFPGSGMPGEVHFCALEDWAIDPGANQFDLFTPILHEIGHALGIEHSLDPDAVMAPDYMGAVTSLTQDDIDAIQRLYGSAGGNVPSIVEPDEELEAFCAEIGDLTALGDPDSDDDGIPDTLEVFVFDTTAFEGDSDGDGLNDFNEIFIDRSDPNDRNSIGGGTSGGCRLTNITYANSDGSIGENLADAELSITGDFSFPTLGLHFDDAVSVSVARTNQDFIFGLIVDTDRPALPSTVTYGDYSPAGTVMLPDALHPSPPLISGEEYVLQVVTADGLDSSLLFELEGSGCETDDSTEPRTFSVTDVSYDSIAISDVSANDVTVFWEGDPVFPVTMNISPVPGECPDGIDCQTATESFDFEENPLVFEGAFFCFGIFETVDFPYELTLTDSSGLATDPVASPFVCEPQEGSMPEPTFVLADILHRGSEQIIAGNAADPNGGVSADPAYDVSHIALSGDGQVIWFTLYAEFPPAGQPRQQLWSINVDGSNARRSTLDSSILLSSSSAPAVVTDDDGSICVGDGLGGSIFKASRGQPAVRLFNPVDTVDPPSDTRGNMRLTDDGTQVYFIDFGNGNSLWRYDTSQIDSIPTAILTSSNIIDPFTDELLQTFENFDITGNASQLAISGTNVVGSSRFYQLIVGVNTMFQNITNSNAPIRDVSIADDGLLLAYCLGQAGSISDPAPCFVQPVGGSAASSELLPSSATFDKFKDMVLADLGERFRVVVTSSPGSGGVGTSVFQIVGQTERMMTGTSRFQGNGPIGSVQLSEDGTVMVGIPNFAFIGVDTQLYVLRDSVDGISGFPDIQSISYRFDDDADTLVVRTTVTSPSGLERIYLLPIKDGLDPTDVVPQEENPFYGERIGGGVNYSTTFALVEGETDVYERSIFMDGKRSFIDSTFRLRVIAVGGTGIRTVFKDFTPLPQS